ncbi:MAG: hypothetical protein ACYCYP_03510 [Leptospirales bacterium]
MQYCKFWNNLWQYLVISLYGLPLVTDSLAMNEDAPEWLRAGPGDPVPVWPFSR